MAGRRLSHRLRMDGMFLAVCVLCVSAVPVDAADRTHEIVPEDYFSIGVVTTAKLSPDGAYAAYTELRWEPPAERRNLDLWVVSTQTKAVRRLTFEPGSDGSPLWSPDGAWIYFLAGRKHAGEDKPPLNGKRQVWRIHPDGSGEMAVTRVEDGVGMYELSQDGKTVYYTLEHKNVDGPFKDLKNEFSELEYGHGVERFTQIWKLDLVNWRGEKIVDENRVIRYFSVSPDERRIAMLTTPSQELLTNEGWSRVDVYDVRTGKVSSPPDRQWRADAASPYGWLSAPAWSSDGSRLAFRVDWDGYPGEIFIVQFGEAGEVSSWKLTRPGEVTLAGEHMEWMPGRPDLCFLAEDHARVRVYCVEGLTDGGQGRALTLTPGDVVAETFSLASDGARALVTLSTTTHPPDVFLVSGSGEQTQFDRLTRVNPQVDTWKLPQLRTVQWKSDDGTDVEGILELPPDYQEGARLPMVVEIHGGPTSSTKYRLRFWIYGRTLMAARGWALLSVNYRGSTGYGDKFLTDLIGHKNDLDVRDILTGVDAMVERGIADPDRLAVMGWSNGGYLTDCLITRTDRFKAASSGAGVFDVITQWLAEDTPGHVINYQQGFPWNRTRQMLSASALMNVDKVRTPTLIHVGEKDERCPPVHSRGLFRALYHYVKVPCELVVYPGEPHGLTQYTHRKAKMAWDLRWFDHYVLDKGAVEDPAATPAKPSSHSQ